MGLFTTWGQEAVALIANWESDQQKASLSLLTSASGADIE